MTNKEAVQIVTSFGGIAEISALSGTDMAAPLSMLPYPKEVIEIAIETYMDSLIRTRNYTEKARNYLKTGYTMLASFVPDEEFRLVRNGQRMLEEAAHRANAHANGDGPAPDEDSDDPREWAMVDKSSEVIMTIQQEMEKRREEIEKFELQQLIAFASGQ